MRRRERFFATGRVDAGSLRKSVGAARGSAYVLDGGGRQWVYPMTTRFLNGDTPALDCKELAD
jgi:hypothetical protein